MFSSRCGSLKDDGGHSRLESWPYDLFGQCLSATSPRSVTKAVLSTDYIGTYQSIINPIDVDTLRTIVSPAPSQMRKGRAIVLSDGERGERS